VDTKIGSEELLWDAIRNRGLAATIVRPATIYGPNCQPFVMEYAKMLKEGSMIHVGHKSSLAGLAFIANVTDALQLAARHDAALGRAFNLHDGLDVTWEQYTNEFADAVGLQRPKLRLPYRLAYVAGVAMEGCWTLLRRKERPALTRLAIAVVGTNQGFSTERIRRELGYVPRVGFREGLQASVEWLKTQTW
jgi:nucleoside-diphosphate-sugar epimerase